MILLNKVINILSEKGPLTGKELLENCQCDALLLWRTCNLSEEISLNIIGQRYLRLDRRIKDYARLSPSILREFLTYTIAGLKSDHLKIESKAKILSDRITQISRDKMELSKDVISQLVKDQKHPEKIEEKAVFIIAGDVVYNMAHDELRPESSTGQMIKGSDLDIIIVTDDLRENIIKKLDDSIYEQKYYLMKRPAYREEIDYVIKDMNKVEEQLQFNTFEFMVASKILSEGEYIYGSPDLYKELRAMLKKYKIPERLKKMEEAAFIEREKAQHYLLNNDISNGTFTQEEYKNLFYTKEETEEIF